MSRRESASTSRKQHSALIGGSNAGRLLQCPGSYQANLALPASVDVPSIYAEEGTFGHAVMAELMHARKHGADDLHALALRWIGREFYDRVLTLDHIDTLIYPALGMLEQLEQAYGGGFEVAMIEATVQFPRIVSAYGTADLILINASFLLLVDYKFGAGVPVKAVYSDEDGEFVNAQLMYYLAAFVHAHRTALQKRRPVVAVVQPRVENGLDHVRLTRKEIKNFVEDIHQAVAIALDRNPPLRRGEECRWCQAKISCPLWTGPLIDLSAMQPVPAPKAAAAAPTPYGDYLAKAKALLDNAVMLKQEIDEQMHAYLESGGMVPGWRLKLKAKQRQWIDQKIVVRTLRKLGFNNAEIFQTKLQTFASVDATARRRNVVIPDMLRVVPPTSETTIAATDDPAPVVDRVLVMEAFGAALAKLRNRDGDRPPAIQQAPADRTRKK